MIITHFKEISPTPAPTCAPPLLSFTTGGHFLIYYLKGCHLSSRKIFSVGKISGSPKDISAYKSNISTGNLTSKCQKSHYSTHLYKIPLSAPPKAKMELDHLVLQVSIEKTMH